MTIKEVEEQTGLTRSNIRFYEKENLIEPTRNDKNGYRNYSESDVENIKKIAYLRTLEISIEDIRNIMSDKVSLEEIIKKQTVAIQTQIEGWNKAKSIIEFLDYIDLKPLILIDNPNFSLEKYKHILTSFFEYFSEIDYIDITEFKFQFKSIIDRELKSLLLKYLIDEYNVDVIEEDFICNKSLNKIYDTAFMLPFIIHNTIFNKNSLSFLRAFDVLEKEVSLTNEVFIGAPGLVNDMGIRKPSYYAYYLLSKLGDEIVTIDNGLIVTKKDDEYCILLYSYTDELEELQSFENIFTKRGKRKIYKKKTSLNIENIKKSSRIITYEISERIGSSYNYWLSMGSPDRLNKEEKEILHRASFPKIEFSYSKKNTILNIITELQGYDAKLIVIKNLK